MIWELAQNSSYLLKSQCCNYQPVLVESEL